jgi:hypothetical protein
LHPKEVFLFGKLFLGKKVKSFPKRETFQGKEKAKWLKMRG